jgi:hypothetical protein
MTKKAAFLVCEKMYFCSSSDCFSFETEVFAIFKGKADSFFYISGMIVDK